MLMMMVIGIAKANQVVDITGKNYLEYIRNTPKEHKTLIKFYAPWCGHCKALAPTYDNLAESFKGNDKVTIARVDCTDNMELCQAFNVKGFPTLKLLHQERVGSYSGSRSLEDMTAFIENGASETVELPSYTPPKPINLSSVVQLTDANAMSFFKTLESDQKVFLKFYAPWCGHCKRFESTLSALAEHYQKNDNVIIGRVDCTQNKETCHVFGIRGYPTLKLINQQKVFEYQGPRDLESVVAFVDGGFSTSTSTALPSSNWFVKFTAELDRGVTMIISDWHELQEKKKGVITVVIIVTLSVGFFMGLTTGLCCWCIVASDPRSKLEDASDDEDENAGDADDKKHR